MERSLMTGSDILVACEKVSTQAEVTGMNRWYNSIEFNPGNSIHGSGERTGWGLRMVRSGKLGVSGEWGVINPFSLVDKVIGSCRYGPEALFSFPGESQGWEKAITSELTAITHSTVQNYLNELQTRIKDIHPSASLSARVQWGTDSFVIMNSNGLRGSYSKTTATTGVSVTLPSDSGLMQSGYSLTTTSSLPVMNDLIEMLLLPIQTGKVDSRCAGGKKKVVFSPAAFSLLLQAVRTGVSGKLLAEGASPLEAMEGKKVMADLLTIRDLPRMNSGGASAPFDSEGISTRDKTLFEDGIFTGFLHDLGSAAECGVESTGSSGRNLGEHSRPVCTNLTVDPSMDGSKDTLTETESGILVTSILSAGGGNAASGNFSLDCGRVYLFKRGEIKGYCDGCVLYGNAYDALSRVIAVGGRQYRVGTDLLPFISLDNISVR